MKRHSIVLAMVAVADDMGVMVGAGRAALVAKWGLTTTNCCDGAGAISGKVATSRRVLYNSLKVVRSVSKCGGKDSWRSWIISEIMPWMLASGSPSPIFSVLAIKKESLTKCSIG